MLKLLKNMRRKEVLMVLLCTVLVAMQVYFDLSGLCGRADLL